MPTSSARYGWPLPELSDPPAGPEQLSDLGLAIEDTINNTPLTTWVPDWTTPGSPKPANATSITGRYAVSQGWCDFSFTMTFGSSTTGGVGIWSWVMPFKGNAGMTEQMVYGMLYEPNYAYFPIEGLINANDNLLRAYAPYNIDYKVFLAMQSTDGGAGTQVPRLAAGGSAPAFPGGRVSFSGRYLIA